MSHGKVGIMQKLEFEMRPDVGCTTFKTSRIVVLDNPSVSVSPSCCCLFRELSRANGLTEGVETLGACSNMGHGVVFIFEAIRQPVYNIFALKMLVLLFLTPRKLADPMTPILKLIALIVSISLVFDSIHKIFVCIEKVNTHF